MAWTIPQHSPTEIDVAGAHLVTPMPDVQEDNGTAYFAWWLEYDHALAVINNWRSSHSFPLNTFQTTLRRNARALDDRSLVAQRIKRLSSIEMKLRLKEGLNLSEMQDIGGCRAVLSSVEQVAGLVRAYKESGLKHSLVHENDYIAQPKRSGYRGHHLIYRYFSDKKTTYNGLKIEVQIRSALQHAWATAVETVGTFIRQALKSSQGEEAWLRFFALMSSAIAAREGTRRVPGTPKQYAELIAELRSYVSRLDVSARLRAFGAALSTLDTHTEGNAHYFLLELDASAMSVKVTGFSRRQLLEASDRFLQVEKSIASQPSKDAVLVSVDSLSALRRAYPNYFLDTGVFLDLVADVTS